MTVDKLQQAIKHLSIVDVYLTASRARHGEGFNPKAAHALEGLAVQTMYLFRRSGVLETEGSDQFILRVVLGFGVRWISETVTEESEPDIKAFVEADYVAEYLMDERLNQEIIDAFALQNASYHVWPYWREYLMSQCERLRMPRKASKKELTEGACYSLNTPDKTTHNVALGREDIQHLQEGTVTKTFTDDTLAGGPVERTVEYKAPFFRPDREEDYRVAWEVFVHR